MRSVELLTSFWQTLCKILLRWKIRNFTMWGVWKSLLHSDWRFVKSFCVEKWEILPCEECGNPYFILTDALKNPSALKNEKFHHAEEYGTLLHSDRRFVKSFCVEKWEISPCWGVWNTLLHSNRRFVKSFCVEKRKISPCEENTNFSRSLFPRKKLKIFFIILSYWGYSELNYNVKNDIKRRKKL